MSYFLLASDHFGPWSRWPGWCRLSTFLAIIETDDLTLSWAKGVSKKGQRTRGERKLGPGLSNSRWNFLRDNEHS